MIFWIEDGREISYDQLIKDLKKKDPTFRLNGYLFFFNLLTDLLNEVEVNSFEDITQHFEVNKKRLHFAIQTSGTTSTPKEVSIKIENCIRHVKTNKETQQLRFWGMGYPVGSFASTQVFFQAFLNKEPILYLFGFDLKGLDTVLSKYNLTNLSCTPTFLSMMLINLNSEYPSIKKITTGGEKIKDSLILAFKKRFVNAEYINIYASTETGSLLYSNSEFFSIPDKYKHLVKIENDTLWVHESLLNASSSIEVNDKWFNTNDLVEWRNKVEFKFVSRSNGFLNTGGYRISPSEIEEAILKLDNVRDVHVYGKPNSLLGTIICADIIGNEIDKKKIKAELTKVIERQKIPQVIRIVETFEFVSNGKKKIMI